jgi:hypothetical protein
MHDAVPNKYDPVMSSRKEAAAKEIIRVAVREKERLGHRAVGTQHLLLSNAITVDREMTEPAKLTERGFPI